MSSIDQLDISTTPNSITGPATISSPTAMMARYKPSDRRFSPLVITPTRGSLTTLQLHRLLTMYAVGGGGEGEVAQLANRFEVDEGKVRALVGTVAVARLYEVGGGAGSGEETEVEVFGVRDKEAVPQGRSVQVQGHHLVQHLVRHEQRRGGGNSR